MNVLIMRDRLMCVHTHTRADGAPVFRVYLCAARLRAIIRGRPSSWRDWRPDKRLS